MGLFAFLPRAASANAGLPFYSTGFDMFTFLVAYPVIALGEGLLLGWLCSRAGMAGYREAIKASFSANLWSAFLGFFFMAIPMFAFTYVWTSLGGAETDVIVMRQAFVGAYLVTVFIEGWRYKDRWGKTWPAGRFWFWSFAVNTLSYGVMGWLFALGVLREQDTAPMLWYFVSRAFRPR